MDLTTVKHIAKLSMLRLSEKELERFAHELTSILDYVASLSEVDTKGVEPTGHAVAVQNVFRADEEEAGASPERARELAEAAPDSENGYVKVKAVL